MTPGATLILVIAVAICGAIGWRIGKWKGRRDAGVALGLCLGVLGLVILAFLPRTQEARVQEARLRMAAEREAQRRMDGYPQG